jgi:hypothetical protein
MAEHAPDRIWSGIDIPKTIAGTLAAVSAAVVGSFLGVAGTLIGAAVASVIGSVGTELYTRFINRGSKKIVSTFVTAPAAVGTPAVVAAEDEVPSDEPAPPTAGPKKMRWGRIAAVAGAVFVLAMGTLTTFELLTQRSMADAVGVKTSSSTTLGSAFSGDNGKRESTPTPAPSSSAEPSEDPGATTEPTDGPAGAPSAEPTDTAGAPSATPTQTTEPVDPQTGETDPGTEPTDQPTDGQDQQDGSTTQDGSTQQQSGE